MTDNVYERYREGNPQEYEELKNRIRDWLRQNQERSYPRTTEIADDVVETDKMKGGFRVRLVTTAIKDLGLEEWNPEAQNSRIRNPFAFDDTVL